MDFGGNISHPKKRIQLVECARGAAAVYVCLHHVNIIGHFADSFRFAKYIFYPLNFGNEAVYLFFFLSGFSIHYSSQNRSLRTLGEVGIYYYQRVRRIYPIFLIAIGVSIALVFFISFQGIPSKTAYLPDSKNLSFLLLFLSDIHGGAFCDGLSNNPALWSLSYEITYYLVYPFFWYFYKKIGIGGAFWGSFFASALCIVAGFFQPNHVANIFSLYWLWTCGALMAEWKMCDKKFSVSPIEYYYTLFLWYIFCQSIEVVVNPLLDRNFKALTVGIIIFSTFIDFKQVSLPLRRLAIGGTVFLTIVSFLLTENVPTLGRHIFLDLRFVIAACVTIWFFASNINIVFLCKKLAQPFFKAGAISYALYVIHMPILYFLADILTYIGLSLYWVVFALYPIFLIAWWLEKKFQIYIVGVPDSIIFPDRN